VQQWRPLDARQAWLGLGHANAIGSTRVGGKSDEAGGHALGKLVEPLAPSPGPAADLPMIEERRQHVGQQSDHREHNDGAALVDAGCLRWQSVVIV
jgi:hypothetical protein